MGESRFQILVVEDAEPDVLLVREALERAGLNFELLVLEDGEKAIDFIEQLERDETLLQPHLVLLDLNLPRMNGSQVLERLRKSTACGRIPVVILTSSDSPSDKAQTGQLGATEYFRKPSRLNEFMQLGQVVRDLLEEQNVNRQPAG
jgi:CheY-like chemotaxis protein